MLLIIVIGLLASTKRDLYKTDVVSPLFIGLLAPEGLCRGVTQVASPIVYWRFGTASSSINRAPGLLLLLFIGLLSPPTPGVGEDFVAFSNYWRFGAGLAPNRIGAQLVNIGEHW